MIEIDFLLYSLTVKGLRNLMKYEAISPKGENIRIIHNVLQMVMLNLINCSLKNEDKSS